MKSKEEITEIEEKFFGRFQEPIWRDGIVDYDKYSNLKNEGKFRLLFILKEANAKNEPGDLRDFLRKGGQGKTWNPVAFWTYGVYNNFPSWDVVKDKNSRELREKWLKKIAVINFKKQPGTKKAYYPMIRKHALKNQVLITKQIVMYEPDIIICCGKWFGNILCEIISESTKDWKICQNGMRYRWTTKMLNEASNPYLILEFYHPQARKTPKWKYENFIESFRETWDKT